MLNNLQKNNQMQNISGFRNFMFLKLMRIINPVAKNICSVDNIPFGVKNSMLKFYSYCNNPSNLIN